MSNESTVIEYEVYKDIGFGELVKLFTESSELLAKARTLAIQSSEEIQYRIVAKITTATTVDIFTVPAYVKTVEDIIEETVSYADGSYHLEYAEGFDSLSESDKEQVRTAVGEEITSCDGCGWHFHVESMEADIASGDLLCYKCYEDRIEDEESEEDDDED